MSVVVFLLLEEDYYYSKVASAIIIIIIQPRTVLKEIVNQYLKKGPSHNEVALASQ